VIPYLTNLLPEVSLAYSLIYIKIGVCRLNGNGFYWYVMIKCSLHESEVADGQHN
jgi:hypothetical protein